MYVWSDSSSKSEFECWHGDHSFVAARIYEYVTSNYRFVKQGEHGFGVSKKLLLTVDMISDRAMKDSNRLREGSHLYDHLNKVVGATDCKRGRTTTSTNIQENRHNKRRKSCVSKMIVVVL